MRAAVSILVCGLLFGCASSAVAPRSSPSAMLVISVWFDPPQPGGGSLQVLHESGYVWRGAAAATGATFLAPEGPCTLIFQRPGGAASETLLKVSSEMADYDWPFGP